MPQLSGRVCLVTGATRGIGKGIALQLAESGATVYITGRTLKNTPGLRGSLEETAAEISERGGGECIPIQCDHSKDEDIQRLFDQIKSEQNGRLDVLVNNAYSAVSAIMKYTKVPYWEQPVGIWDEVNNVGLRNHYACAVYAAQLMVPRGEGLIVNISSAGGLSYVFNVAYGIGKEACDRMAADCGHELRRHNVTFVSLWPGAVMTEAVEDMLQTPARQNFTKGFFSNAESTEFAGKAVVNLAADPAVIKKTGRVFLTTDLADEYGFTESDGARPLNFRSLRSLVSFTYPSLASYMPRWIRLPRWILTLYGSKF